MVFNIDMFEMLWNTYVGNIYTIIWRRHGEAYKQTGIINLDTIFLYIK